MSTEKFFDSVVSHTVGLQRYANGLSREVLEQLSRREKRVLKIIQDELSGEKILTRRQRDVLIAKLRTYDTAFFAKLSTTLAESLVTFAATESVWAGTRVKSLLGSAKDPKKYKIGKATVQRAFDRPLSQRAHARTISELLNDTRRNSARRTQTAVRRGFMQGSSVPRLMRELRGTKAFDYKDGLFNVDRREAQLMVRTSLNAVANQVRDEVYEQNDDLIDRIMWISTLDSRTSSYCSMQDHQIYPIDSGPRPPGHPNCRSTVLPLLKGEKKLFGTRFARNAKGNRTTIGANTNYEGWLRRQPAAVQDEVLGKTKGALFRRGKLPLSKIRSTDGTEYTLTELRRREAKLFKQLSL